MKRILPILLCLPSLAFADPSLIMSAPSASGGKIMIFEGVTQCNTGIGALLVTPFTENVPGCVTSVNPGNKTFHVFYKTGEEMDYDFSGWTTVKTTKGAL